MKTWTEKEVAALRAAAPFGISAVELAVPQKNRGSLYCKASKIGVSIVRKLAYDRNGDELTNKRWAWENRIAPFLTKKGECLEWHYSNTKGYGQLRIYAAGEKRIFSTHRIAFEVARGALVEPGFGVLHRCDNPKCNNPEHLFMGTDKDNGADRHAKGRTRGKLFFKGQPPNPNRAKGTQKTLAKMNDEKVREARAIYDSGVMGHKLLARKFGVCPRTMYLLVKRQGWKHVA